MKSLVLFTVFLLCVDLSLQLPKLVNCPPDFVPPSSIMDSCGIYTCHGSNKVVGVGCALYHCPKNSTGHDQQDNSKPFPDCCGGPICQE